MTENIFTQDKLLVRLSIILPLITSLMLFSVVVVYHSILSIREPCTMHSLENMGSKSVLIYSNLGLFNDINKPHIIFLSTDVYVGSLLWVLYVRWYNCQYHRHNPASSWIDLVLVSMLFHARMLLNRSHDVASPCRTPFVESCCYRVIWDNRMSVSFMDDWLINCHKLV